MSKKSYLEKLKDPRWQKKRLEILERDGWYCQMCGDDKTTLHVHHTKYIKNLEPWEAPDKTLITLCEDCHNVEHIESKESLDHIIDSFRLEGILSSDIYDLLELFYSEKISRKKILRLLRNGKTVVEYMDKEPFEK